MINMKNMLHKKRGATLVDVVVGASIVSTVFVVLLLFFSLQIKLVSFNKYKVAAAALIQDTSEVVRSLQYDDVGLTGNDGQVDGILDSIEILEANGIEFSRTINVTWRDDPADGESVAFGGTDTLATDYKLVTVTVAWEFLNEQYELVEEVTISPRGVESNPGGGSMLVKVFDATNNPVGEARVDLLRDGNNDGDYDDTVDFSAYDTTFSNSSDNFGSVLFQGVPAGANYEVVVSKPKFFTGDPSFTTDQTYDSDVVNVAPEPGHKTIGEGLVTTGTFYIDLDSTLNLTSWTIPYLVTFSDEFDDGSQATFVNTTTSSGEAGLSAANYGGSGTVTSVPIIPSDIYQWIEFRWNATVPSGTSVTLQFMHDNDGDGTLNVIPSTELPGNATGFNHLTSSIDLSSIDSSTYDEMYIRAELTGNGTETPSIDEWELDFNEAPVLSPNKAYALRGTKIKGATSTYEPIYRYDEVVTTDSNSEYSSDVVVWDKYSMEVAPSEGEDIAAICPYDWGDIDPDEVVDVDVYMAPGSTHSLRIVVLDEDTGLPVNGLDVRLFNGTTYENVKPTIICGQVFFGGVDVSAGVYDVEITESDGDIVTLPDVAVNGDTVVVSNVDDNGPTAVLQAAITGTARFLNPAYGDVVFGVSTGETPEINATRLTGELWGDHVGWMSLNSGGSTSHQVTNSCSAGVGNLGGYAWGENTGWINFAPASGGVQLSDQGQLDGYAWSQNFGWIEFDCSVTGYCVNTTFTCI